LHPAVQHAVSADDQQQCEKQLPVQVEERQEHGRPSGRNDVQRTVIRDLTTKGSAIQLAAGVTLNDADASDRLRDSGSHATEALLCRTVCLQHSTAEAP